ncbi:MAG: CHRD domain-containing protein [Verrucomicrobiota bacterium]
MKIQPPMFTLSLAAAVVLATATAQAQIYTANLSGPAESPPNASPGTGFAQVTLSLATHQLTVHVDFTGLSSTTTASHIHAPTAVPGAGTAGVATQTPTFSGFPLGVTSGTYDHVFDTLDAATWNSAYVTANGGTPAGAEAAFAQALAEGRAYWNIHTNLFPGGEIRGFLVPEPGTFVLVAVGGIALLFAKRRIGRS